jgi:hypothetical protein
MQIAELKRWQWACIGLALGLGISIWRGLLGFDAVLDGRSTLDTGRFEQLLVRKTPSGQPAVKEIRAYRMDDGSYWLSAEEFLVKTSGGAGVQGYVPVKIRAKTPYVPKTQPAAKVDPNFTVVDYLQSVKAKHPEVRFSTRWWDREPVRSPMFAVAGMALLGGIAPLLMSALVGAAPAGQKKEPEYDLSRFGKGEESAPAPVRAAMSEQDREKLRQLEAELERNLAARSSGGASEGLGISGGPAGSAPSESAASAAPQPSSSSQPLRKLEGGPLQSAADAQPVKDKRYAGEYYPTSTHVKND